MFGTDARRLAFRLIATASAATAALSGLAGPALAGETAAPAVGTIAGAGAAGAIAGSYIVVLDPASAGTSGVTSASQELVRAYGGTVVDDYSATIRGFHLRASAEQARRIAADPAVRYVEQDATISTAGQQAADVAWGTDRIDQQSLPLSNTYSYRSAADVTAYVIDTGIRTSHQEFAGRAASGWDFVGNDPVADDCHGHGTHVAGTIGGATHGVAKDVKLVGLKVLGCDGLGSYADFVAAVDWVTEHAQRPAVANMSLGGEVSQALDEAVTRSIASGVTYTIAGGNEEQRACDYSPGRTPAAITVGATDRTDRRAWFSNYGTCLDLFAPGADIRSAGIASDTAAETMSGTSMAAPHVAGAAALVLGAHPDWAPQQVRDDLVAHAGTGLVRNAGSGSPNLLLHTGHLIGAA
ncbi:S8 family peptidase [Actinoplanes sp. NPDC024001]|uniref:S8 family peptidase n=1 Tax=Actinoplanes sp. NPDC024001 TaxID=3154598 RepID=UPI003404F244